ncbi:MAG TPA: FG-GAP-like repeat-containing protein [Bryobacteraceae bacterium]
MKPLKAELDRRAFLRAACASPVLAALVGQPAMWAEPNPQRAPYLKLAPFLAPGIDEFPEEAVAMKAEAALRNAMRSGELPVVPNFGGASLLAKRWRAVSADIHVAEFDSRTPPTGPDFREWLHSLGQVRRAQFFVLPGDRIRYEVAGTKNGQLLYVTGAWKALWSDAKLTALSPLAEVRAEANEPKFRDVTGSVFAGCKSFDEQLRYGVPYWRARLDAASGIDLYGSNGIAVGDIDNDGVDEIFVCQPGGLPNRLYRFHEGRMEDITREWGVDLLDDTSAALFLDLRNIGRQDLVVLRAAGPLLYLNEGGRFRLRSDAFRFGSRPQGGFTGMAAADYDRDGKLDLYLCTYVYFQSEAQYTYPVPYHDAQNGPPNFLFRNRLEVDGSGSFEDVTQSSGVSENNNRFSFAPSWCDTDGNGWPDLYVANDFGRNNFYKNDGGRFHDRAAAAGIEDMGPGMSSSWLDYDGDGRPDLYVANMWTASGQRVVHSPKFAPAQGSAELAEAYRRHTKGNSLYRNKGDGSFEETTAREGVDMGRWAWSSVGHDWDNDGSPEIAIGCGMLSNDSDADMMSFFWRQVVSRSPSTAKRAPEYENGWNAINQFIREDSGWNGREPNVFYQRCEDHYFDVSGISGFDFADDTRAFAITDFDGDGRPDLILKNRLGPQIRVLQNNCAGENQSIAIELEGTKSNRDAIGAKIEVLDAGPAIWLSAESGYLSQHSKKLIIGLGKRDTPVTIKITWPSGLLEEVGPLAIGYVYRITEGSKHWNSKPFSKPHRLDEKLINAENTPKLHATWFKDRIPLPEPVTGPCLVVLKGQESIPSLSAVPVKVIDLGRSNTQRARWGIFRRYLFDYRQELKTPLSFLVDRDGNAAKVYPGVPSEATATADWKMLQGNTKIRQLPFIGSYQLEPHRDYFKFAVAFLWEGQDEAALPYLHELVRRGSDNARIPRLIGQIYLQSGKLDEAEQYIRKALDINPEYADAWSELGSVFEARKNIAQALVCYQKALALQPGLTYVQVNAAHAAEVSGDNQKAERYYREALKSDPKNADAANGLGLMLAKQAHYDEAKQLFQRAIEDRPDFASAINNLGVLYLNTGKSDDAVAAFEYGLKVAPDEDILYLNLGRVYARQGQMERARDVMQRLLARKPGNTLAERALRELENR